MGVSLEIKNIQQILFASHYAETRSTSEQSALYVLNNRQEQLISSLALSLSLIQMQQLRASGD